MRILVYKNKFFNFVLYIYKYTAAFNEMYITDYQYFTQMCYVKSL